MNYSFSIFGEEWTLEQYITSLDGKRHFLFGGFDANEYSDNSTSQIFHTRPPLPEKRLYSAATAIDDDRLIVVGGYLPSIMKSCLCTRRMVNRLASSQHWPL